MTNNLTPRAAAKMRTLVFTFTLVTCWLMSFNANAQVAVTNPGNTTPALAATYTSLDNAITALNATTAIAGPIVITLTGDETAPLGGYAITAIPAGASDINSITIEGNGSTITAFSPQATGLSNNAIFKLIGADYITMQNFTMQENTGNTVNSPATSNNMTEFGVALFYASVTNGSQHNTIKNNIISLNRTYRNTFGIYSNTRHSAISMTTVAEVTGASGSNSFNKVYGNSISNVNFGIHFTGAGSTALMDNGNDIGGSSLTTGNTITNWGAGPALTAYVSIISTSAGVFANQQINENVSYNTVTSAVLAQASVYGIIKTNSVASPTSGTITSNINNNTVQLTNNATDLNGGVSPISMSGLSTLLPTTTININNNTIQNCNVGGSIATSGFFYGITNGSVPGVLNINGNSILNNSITVTSATGAHLKGIWTNLANLGTLNINNNIISGMYSTGTMTNLTGIENTGAVQNAININNNQLGTASSGLYSSAGASNYQIFVIESGNAAATCNVSIQSNDFRGINIPVLSSTSLSFIRQLNTPNSINISSNTFTNLNINTTGGILFILGFTPGSLTIDNNAIVNSFARGGSGSTMCIQTAGNAPNGVTSAITNNNFSNITALTSQVQGISDAHGTGTASPAKTCTGNTFNNWSCGSATVIGYGHFGAGISTISNNTIQNLNGGPPGHVQTGIYIGNSFNGGTAVNVCNNLITNITGGFITGIYSENTSPQLNIYSNTISSFATLGGAYLKGIVINGATNNNVFKNKICDLSGNTSAPLIRAIDCSAGTTNNIYNNIIGDLRAPAANSYNSLNGIYISGGTNINLFYNTVFLNATSTGALFGSSALYAFASPVLTLRNNIFFNASGASGAGKAAAYRRSGTSLTSYNAASDNNLFYGSTIFTDSINSDITLTAYKARVAPRDAASISENLVLTPTFLSTTCGAPGFLHVNTLSSTQTESGGLAIGGITEDFDGDTRNVSTPDIGADEFSGCFIAAGITPSAFTICAGQNQTLTSNAPGGVSWLWSTGATTQSISVFSSANTVYTVTVTSGSGCSMAVSVAATINPNPVPSISGYTSFCTGGSTVLDAGAYSSYAWSTGETTQTISVNTAGAFTVTVTNANGCTGTGLASTTVGSNLIPSISGSTSFCPGNSTSLDAGNYANYNWSTGATTRTISVNTAGAFTVSVTNAPGCTGSTSVLTTVNANPIPSISGSTLFCSGSPVTLNAGVFTSYNWSTGATTQTISANTMATFMVTVTNANGCTGSTSVSTVNANSIQPITGNTYFCSGSATTLDIGSGYSSYLWSTGVTTQIISVSAVGTFTVTVTNVNGCSASKSATVTVNQTPNVNQPTNQTLCKNAPVAAVAFSGTVPGTIYYWTNSNTSIGLAASGTGNIPSFTGLNNTGAPNTATITVTPATEVVSGGPSGAPVPEVLFYDFDSSGTTIVNYASAAPPGTETAFFLGTSTQGASGQCGGALISPGGNANCLYTNWYSDFTGAFTMSFWLGAGQINNNPSYLFGDYDANIYGYYGGNAGVNNMYVTGGSGNILITGVNPAATLVTIVTDGTSGTDVYKNGVFYQHYAVTFNTAGYGEFMIGGLYYSPGMNGKLDEFRLYNRALNASEVMSLINPCSVSTVCTGTPQTFTVTVNPDASISGNTTLCAGNSTVLDAGSNSSYNWSTGATTQTISVNTVGTFTVTVTNANGCTSSASVSTTVNANPIPSISGNTLFCSGSSTTLNAGSFTSYNWSTGAATQTISPNTAGTFTVTITNVNGCTGSASVSTTVNASPTPSISGNTSFCSGSSTILNAGLFSSYNWSTGATTQTVSVNTSGTLTVTVTNVNGCTGSTSVSTTVNSNPIPSISGSTSFCAGSSTVLNVGSYSSYSWSTGATTQTISVNTAGTFAVTVANGSGCTGTTSVSTTVNANPTLSISGSTSFCAGSSTTLNAGSYSSYTWSTGATTQTISVNTAGTFTVSVINGNGCTSSSSFTTTVNSIPTPSISGNASFCAGNSAILNAGAGYSSYNWSTGATTQTISVSNAGTFIVTVSNGFGCTASASKTVTISAQPVPSISGGSSFCSPGSVALNAGAGYSSYAWSIGATTQTINVSSAGTYTVTVTNAGGCSGSANKVITGNASPAQPGAVTGATTICKNSNETYSIIPVPGATSYTWTATSGASVSSGQGSATVVVNFSNVATSASISVVAVNACGNSVAKTLAYAVTSALPSQPSTLNGQLYGVCNQNNVPYTCPATVNASSYQWTVPAGVTLLSGQGTNAITVKYTSSFAGTGTISVAAVSGCGSSATISRTVNSKPQQPVVSGQNWACPGQTGLTYSVTPVAGATSYAWTVVAGSTIVSGQGTTSITVNWGSINGIIKCTANNACGSSIPGQLAVSFTCKEATDNLNFSELSLYPNPASTSATLQFDGYAEGNTQLAVYDLIGQQLINKDVAVVAGRNEYALDLTSLAKGTYMVRVVYDGVTRYSKLIVQ